MDEFVEQFRESLQQIEPERQFDTVSFDTVISDLGIDSISLVEIVGILEDRYGVSLQTTRLRESARSPTWRKCWAGERGVPQPASSPKSTV